jgi:TRAP-type C4-dicarboxylate transport system permease small subunit
MGSARKWVLAAGSVLVAIMYLWLTWISIPLMEIAADERSPIMNVPGSITVICLMLGFTLLSLVTVCQIPSILSASDAAAEDTPNTQHIEGADA